MFHKIVWFKGLICKKRYQYIDIRLPYILGVYLLEKTYLSTAPLPLTELLSTLTSFWQDRGINICVYLDEQVGIEKLQCTLLSHFQIVRN